MRHLKRVLLVLCSVVLGFYLLLAGGLTVLEHVVQENSHDPQVLESLDARSTAPHRVLHLDNGAASFVRRMELIEGAKKSIELEFFIYNVDRASRLLTSALLKKAKQGVAVRVLVDFSAPVFQLQPAYAKLMAEAGVKVRYYNTSAAYRLVSIQHRSHRKLLIVDGKTVITGGRNIGDDYFDFSQHYNFLDSDLEVTGPIVKTVRDSFDVYWRSRLSKDPETEKNADPALAEAFTPGEGDSIAYENVRLAGHDFLRSRKARECRDLRFVTDFPNHGEASRKVFNAIVEELGRAKHEAVVESPYFVIKTGGYAVLEDLQKRGVKVEVLTNSLASTDASYAVAALYPRLGGLASAGLTLHAYKGGPLAGQSTDVAGGEPRWGVHSKRGVIDRETTLLGTYNIDPRSANLNSELMLVCRGSKELAADVIASIDARRAASRPVLVNGAMVDRGGLLGEATWRQRLRFLLEMPVANLFDFLL